MATIAKLWKEPRCPTKDEWIKKMWKERKKERGRDIGRGRRSRLHAGSPMGDLITGPQDHALNQRQTLNH